MWRDFWVSWYQGGCAVWKEGSPNLCYSRKQRDRQCEKKNVSVSVRDFWLGGYLVMDTLFIVHETDSFFSSLTPGRPSNTDKWTWPVRRCRQTGWMSIRVVMDVLELDMAHFQVLSLPWDGKTLSRCLLDILTATILYSSETCFLLWKIVDGRPHSCNQNTRENKSKKKALFWLMVSEVHSVVNLVPLILGWQWGRRPWLQHMEQDALCTGYLGSRPSVAFKGSLPVACVLQLAPTS